MPTQRFNTSRRMILLSRTAQEFYPKMQASNILYGARDTAYGASTAEQIGQLVGTLGTAAAAEVSRLEQARAQAAAEVERQKEETKRAESLAQAAETLKSVVPWVVAGVIGVVVVPKIFKLRST